MSKRVWLLAVLGLWMGAAKAAAEGVTGNIDVLYGNKSLNKDEWEPTEEHSEAGIHLDFRPASWPVNLEVSYLKSESAEEGALIDLPPVVPIQLKLETSEVQLGVRKIWEVESIRPFLGGGLTLASAKATISLFGDSVSESGNGTGFWAAAGIYWTLGGHFNIGVDARISSVEAKVFDEDAKIGGTHIAAFVGYHF